MRRKRRKNPSGLPLWFWILAGAGGIAYIYRKEIMKSLTRDYASATSELIGEELHKLVEGMEE